MVEKSTEAHKPTQQELEDIFREGDNMDAAERMNLISILEWRTNFSFEYLKSLTDEQLDKLYKERVG